MITHMIQIIKIRILFYLFFFSYLSIVLFMAVFWIYDDTHDPDHKEYKTTLHIPFFSYLSIILFVAAFWVFDDTHDPDHKTYSTF